MSVVAEDFLQLDGGGRVVVSGRVVGIVRLANSLEASALRTP